ncbi:MAG: NAD(P)-dependent oxidoreductase [Acidimicrobiia bacterium]|nr:NAD(P)-dependent oxidoreductase [Acidimicrobiia bacterium]
MRRILVTGGSGFIGTNLVEHFLRADSTEVLNYDHAAPRCQAHAPHWRRGDLRAVELRPVLAEFQPTHVVHLAARTDLDGRTMHDYVANIEGVEAVLDCLVAADRLERVIFASSRIVCELGEVPVSDYDYCPPNLYGRSKVIGEQLVRAHPHDSSWVIVRPTSIWGPWGGAPYRDFFLSVARGTYVHPGRERIPRHYGYVGNVVFQLDRLLDAPAEHVDGRTFYLADFEPTEVFAFAAAIRRELGHPPPRSVPVPLLRLLARSMDAVKATGWVEPPLTSSRSRRPACVTCERRCSSTWTAWPRSSARCPSPWSKGYAPPLRTSSARGTSGAPYVERRCGPPTTGTHGHAELLRLAARTAKVFTKPARSAVARSAARWCDQYDTSSTSANRAERRPTTASSSTPSRTTWW